MKTNATPVDDEKPSPAVRPRWVPLLCDTEAMSNLRHAGEVAHEINRDYEHEIGVALIYGAARGSGWAVIHQGPATVLAWDGGYTAPFDSNSEHVVPLVELDVWSDRDVIASQAVQERSGVWLKESAPDLMPSYSFDVKAIEILRSWLDSEDQLPSGYDIVAYFPTTLTYEEAMRRART